MRFFLLFCWRGAEVGETAERIAIRIRERRVVEVVMLDAIVAVDDRLAAGGHFSGNADNGGEGRNVVNHHRGRADAAVMADGDRPQDDRPRTDDDAILKRGMTLPL